MASQHEVRGRLTLRGEEWKRGLDRAGRQSQQFQRNVIRGMKLVTAAIVGGSLIAGIRRLGHSFVETGKKFDEGFAKSIVRFQEAMENVRRAIFAALGPGLHAMIDRLSGGLEENAKTVGLWAAEWAKWIQQTAALGQFYADLWGEVFTNIGKKIEGFVNILEMVGGVAIRAFVNKVRRDLAKLQDTGLLPEEAIIRHTVTFAQRLTEIETKYAAAVARVNAIDFDTKGWEEEEAAAKKALEAALRAMRHMEAIRIRQRSGAGERFGPTLEPIVAPELDRFADGTIWTRSYQQFQEMTDRQREQAERVAGHISNVFGTAFREIFAAGKTGAEKWRAIWHSMINAVAEELERLLAKQIAFSILDFLLPGSGAVASAATAGIGGGGSRFDNFDFSSPTALAPRRPSARAGGDRPSVVVNLTIPRGSLLMADDEIAVRRWSTRIADAAERGVNRTYRPLKPIVQPASVRG
jgi:hypothetical protein